MRDGWSRACFLLGKGDNNGSLPYGYSILFHCIHYPFSPVYYLFNCLLLFILSLPVFHASFVSAKYRTKFWFLFQRSESVLCFACLAACLPTSPLYFAYFFLYLSRFLDFCFHLLRSFWSANRVLFFLMAYCRAEHHACRYFFRFANFSYSSFLQWNYHPLSICFSKETNLF